MHPLGELLLGVAFSYAAYQRFKNVVSSQKNGDETTPPDTGGSRLSGIRRDRALSRVVTTDRHGDRLTGTTYEVKDINERVNYIRGMIKKYRYHPQTWELAAKIVGKRCGDTWCAPEKDNDAEINAVFKWFRAHVRYARDPFQRDTFQAPHRTAEAGRGDCDDYAIGMGAVLQNLGYPVKLRVIQTRTSEDWNHIYLLVGLPPQNPSQWVPLDGSMPQPAGWEAPSDIVKRRRDFDID